MEDLVLEALRNGATRALVDSPPGAGKTYLVESVVQKAIAEDGWSVGVATHTRNQRDDLAVRIRNRFPELPLQVLLASRESAPAPLSAPGIRTVSDIRQLQVGRGVIVSTVARQFYMIEQFAQQTPPYDLVVVDEAYQVQYKDGLPLDVLANRRMMVGDPGQIAPFSELDTEIFETARDHVLWALPIETLEKEPNMARFELHVSRRLPPDTVRIVRPAFYPNLSFEATSVNEERRLSFTAVGFAADRIDRALDAIEAGASMVVIQLPDLGYEMDVDDELCDEAVAVTRRLLTRGARWNAENCILTAADIGYCDSHVDSGTRTRTKLADANLCLYFADTPNVIQGRETLVTVVKHPLSSMQAADGFHLDPGRLCVMLSRHKLACIVLVRGDVGRVLRDYEHDCGQRLAGREDVVWRGYSAHQQVWNSMQQQGRIFA